MIARLTALILSFCIALPMCWCCVGSEPPQAEMTGCCAMSQHAASDQQPHHTQDQNCPCAKHENKRDVTDLSLKAPLPALTLLAEQTWTAAELELPTSAISDKNARCHDHRPPLVTPPLYERHCALLI